MNLRNSMKQHPIFTYFMITFLISWGSVIYILGLNRIIGTPQERKDLLYVVVFPLLSGPTIASLSLITILYGKSGLKEFASRLTNYKVRGEWYLVAILFVPLLGFSSLLLLSPISSAFLPAILTTDSKVTLLLTALIIGFSAGIFEEIGWTGLAIQELRKKYDVLTSGLILGFIWGVWHYIQAIWFSGNEYREFTMSLFLPVFIFAIAVLPAYRMIMVWVYDHTKSILIAIIMHASLTGNVIYLMLSPELTANGTALTIWYLIFSIPLWLTAALIIIFEKRKVILDTKKNLAFRL